MRGFRGVCMDLNLKLIWKHLTRNVCQRTRSSKLILIHQVFSLWQFPPRNPILVFNGICVRPMTLIRSFQRILAIIDVDAFVSVSTLVFYSNFSVVAFRLLSWYRAFWLSRDFHLVVLDTEIPLPTVSLLPSFVRLLLMLFPWSSHVAGVLVKMYRAPPCWNLWRRPVQFFVVLVISSQTSTLQGLSHTHNLTLTTTLEILSSSETWQCLWGEHLYIIWRGIDSRISPFFTLPTTLSTKCMVDISDSPPLDSPSPPTYCKSDTSLTDTAFGNSPLGLWVSTLPLYLSHILDVDVGQVSLLGLLSFVLLDFPGDLYKMGQFMDGCKSTPLLICYFLGAFILALADDVRPYPNPQGASLWLTLHPPVEVPEERTSHANNIIKFTKKSI